MVLAQTVPTISLVMQVRSLVTVCEAIRTGLARSDSPENNIEFVPLLGSTNRREVEEFSN